MINFDDLYQQYAQDVYRFAYWLTNNANMAEEITSETFLRAWASADRIQAVTVKGYLLTIARNLVARQGRQAQQRKGMIEPITEVISESVADRQPSLAEVMEQRATLQAVQHILANLAEVDRTAFLLRVEEDISYEEIAQILELTVVAAKVKVHRVRQKVLRLNGEV